MGSVRACHTALQRSVEHTAHSAHALTCQHQYPALLSSHFPRSYRSRAVAHTHTTSQPSPPPTRRHTRVDTHTHTPLSPLSSEPRVRSDSRWRSTWVATPMQLRPHTVAAWITARYVRSLQHRTAAASTATRLQRPPSSARRSARRSAGSKTG